MKRIMIGIIAVFVALVLVGTNGLAMKTEMTKTSLDLELAYNFYDEVGYNDTLGAVADFQNDNGDHESMLSVSYRNNAEDYNLTFSTYNETDGLIVTAEDYTRGVSQVYYFEPRNNSAVLNDTFYWTYADTVPPLLFGNQNPEPDVTLVEMNIGYYADSEDFYEWLVWESGSISAMNFSLVVYQGFLIWSIPGSIIYYTDLDQEQPTDHVLRTEVDGCQCNCIFDDKLYFASDDTLYQMEDSILDPAWDSFDIGKPNKHVTALDVYMDDEDTAHLVICYSNDSVIYEFSDEEVVPCLELSQDINIYTIENTRNYNGDFYASGVTNDNTGFVAQISGATSYDFYEFSTDDADANAMCNLTSTEQLYVFNQYDGGDFDGYHYAGVTPPEEPSEGEGITITLTQAGHWTTGESASELYANVGDLITVKAHLVCEAGLDTVTLRYTDVGETTYNSVAMTLSTGTDSDGTWTATIPAQTTVGDVLLKITGTSGSDTHTTTVYTLDIVQETAPTPNILDTLLGYCNLWWLLLFIIAVIIILYYMGSRK
jgi:hypothetical protein